MKKSNWISVGLCLLVLLQCLPVSASALPVEVPQTVAVEETMPMEAETVDTENTLNKQDSEIPFGQLSIVKGCRTIEGMVPLGGSERRLASAQGVFVYEMDTGTVVYSYNADVKLSPGTLAKLVTAIVAIENCELDEVVTCSDGIQSKIPGGSQNVKLKSGEQLTVEDLLHCLLLHSANDAAVALAEHVSGSRNAYLELMNNWVRKIGCTGTEFGNISGLDTAVSYTTARDMAKIMAEASANETFARIYGTAKYEVPATNLTETARSLTTTNYIIDNSVIPQFLDTNVKGGLASYSEGSGASIVCVAEYNSMKLVCVVLGAMRVFDAEESWKPVTYGNFEEMQALLEYVYGGFKVNRILYCNQALCQFQVIDGECDVVGQPSVNIDTVLPVNCNMDNLYMKCTPTGNGYQAPIEEGDKIATVAIQYLTSYVAEAELYAMNSVRNISDTDVTVYSTAVKTDNETGGFFGFLSTIGVIAVGGFGLYIAMNAYRRARRRIQHRRRRASRRRSY